MIEERRKDFSKIIEGLIKEVIRNPQMLSATVAIWGCKGSVVYQSRIKMLDSVGNTKMKTVSLGKLVATITQLQENCINLDSIDEMIKKIEKLSKRKILLETTDFSKLKIIID